MIQTIPASKPFMPLESHISLTVFGKKIPKPIPEEVELDPDFTPEEHAEFAQFERDHPYVEEYEEKVRVPPRPVDASDGKHDVLFLLLFVILAAVFLLVITYRGLP